MGKLLGNSAMPNYVKLMAAIILVFTYLAALGLGVVDYAREMPIPNEVTIIIGAGLGLAMNVLGVHQGVQLSEGNSHASSPTA